MEFSPGVMEATVQVNTLSDSLAEDFERFNVILSSPSDGATLGRDTATVDIEDLTGKESLENTIQYTMQVRPAHDYCSN